MKVNIFATFFALLLSANSHSQESEKQASAFKAKFDSAKLEFENFEKMYGGFVQTKNIELHYLEWGNPKGTPLIWIHGSFTNSYELFDIAHEIVKKGYHLIAIDYYGHGQTKIPEHEVSLYHVADDIETLMDVKNIKKAVIGGWSRGGIIASAFYDSYPEKVLGLILEDGGSVSTNTHYHGMTEADLKKSVSGIFRKKFSYSRFPTQFDAYKAYYDSGGGGTQFTLLAWMGKDDTGLWTIGSGLEKLFHMTNEQEFLETILRPTKATLFAESMSILEPKIIFRNLTVPILILDAISEDDLFPYEAENEALYKQHPHLIVYKKYKATGHNIHYEKPETFIRDLGEFLGTIKARWKNLTD